jgi:hypothetical protein
VVGAAWSVIVNFTTLEPASPLAGSVTVTEAVPGLTRSEAGTLAVREVAET